jgi:hypothetical protein
MAVRKEEDEGRSIKPSSLFHYLLPATLPSSHAYFQTAI